MDAAPRHFAKKTTQWLPDRGIKFIPKEIWLANSLDLSPLDYAINSQLKENIKGKVATEVDRLESIAKREWNKFEISKIRNALLGWAKTC